jgi:hypothetical protein
MFGDIDLTEPERELCARAAVGGELDLREKDGQNDPSRGKDWPRYRVVRAEVVHRLILSNRVPGVLTALKIFGAKIIGSLDLRGLKLLHPLELCECYVDESVLLTNAEAVSVCLRGSYLRDGLSANQLKVQHDLDLSRGFFSLGQVCLRAASVEGTLNCDGGFFHNVGGTALAGDLLNVTGHALLGDQFQAIGQVELTGCRVGGQLSLTGGVFRGAVRADGIYVCGDMMCASGFEAHDEVRLLGAHIAGQLVLTGGKFHKGLTADAIQVEQSVFCMDGFEANGDMRLLGAHIGGQLELADGKFHNYGGSAINAGRLQVEGDIICGGNFQSYGEVRLLGAHVGGGLRVTGGSFQNCAGKFALNAEGLVMVGQGQWNPDDVGGDVHLGFAQAAVWSDSKQGRLAPTVLRHFRYTALHPGADEVPVKSRLEWLRRDPTGYSPQPYSQLAAVYRAEGRDRQARTVLIASQTDRRKGQTDQRRGKGPFGWLRQGIRQGWGWIMQVTVGYGYRPWIALIWLIAALLVGSLMFECAIPPEQLTASSGAPPWNAFLYVLDMLVPVLDMGYSKWVATKGALGLTALLVVMGWVLATAVVAAFAGLLRRGD